MQFQLCVKPWMPRQCFGDPPLVCAAAELPYWEGRGGRRFNRYYRAYGRAFTRYVEKVLVPETESEARWAAENGGCVPGWEAELRTVITLDTPRVVSLYTDTVETGGGRRRVLRRGDTWEKDGAAPMTAGDFFPPHTPWRRMILSAAAEQIRRNEAAYYPDWPHRLRRSFHSRAFYLGEEGLWVYFPMYALRVPVTAFLLPWSPEGPRLPWEE